MLTREQISGMKPGQELDALVAEKVMGYKFVQEGSTLWKDDAPFPFLMYNEEFGYCLYEKYDDGWPFTTFNPSTDIAAAWEVFTKIDFNAERSSVHHGMMGEWMCKIDDITSPQCKTAPEAICKAALISTLEV